MKISVKQATGSQWLTDGVRATPQEWAYSLDGVGEETPLTTNPGGAGGFSTDGVGGAAEVGGGGRGTIRRGEGFTVGVYAFGTLNRFRQTGHS